MTLDILYVLDKWQIAIQLNETYKKTGPNIGAELEIYDHICRADQFEGRKYLDSNLTQGHRQSLSSHIAVIDFISNKTNLNRISMEEFVKTSNMTNCIQLLQSMFNYNFYLLSFRDYP